ncbi:hypothetical protein [Nocardia sp. NPDC051570]|uniref:hypothetical protein n=1 Tax=Nocardia sp. NPDC051570 TaxID=3364324 RepID=UPI003790ACEA
MVDAARALLGEIQKEPKSDEENRLALEITRGRAPRSVLAAFAAEQQLIITSAQRSFLTLAARSTDRALIEFVAQLVQRKNVALDKLASLAAACGMDDTAFREYEPLAGCQAYAGYEAWLALNGDPHDVLLAVASNLDTWCSYCAMVTRPLRDHYGLTDDACGFFDLFATPVPGRADRILAIIQGALDRGWAPQQAHTYRRLLHDYELMFWNTLADRHIPALQ